VPEKLIDLKAPRSRFARSINVERDSGSEAIDGYLPVGRAIDAISRLAAALNQKEAEVALSITGPYGSGKSSLAIIIDALLGPANDQARRSAERLLEEVSPEVLDVLREARSRLGANEAGFIRASATASREPVAATVLRALINGVDRFVPRKGQVRAHHTALARLRQMQSDYEGEGRICPDSRLIRREVELLSSVAPILILIDEFGKNLEAFADAASDADLFLLQELAEWTRGVDGIPLALVTLQHMAFDEYATGASAPQRREWAKIQGRFEDIPFIDSPAQTRSLIAAAFDAPDPRLEPAIDRWASKQTAELAKLGSGDLLLDKELIAACWPLHPVALAVLPDLCERYGQNERTLFSFLAGHEPKSVATFLSKHSWAKTRELPAVRLDALYDYFVDSAATVAAISSAASRWVEIDNRIRDARGVDDAGRRVLKTVGLLNLISAGGTLRASQAVVAFAATDGHVGTATPEDVIEQLRRLEDRGLITYRDFADEFRVWQGSDFNLKTAIDVSMRRIRDVPAARLVEAVLPLAPVVAGRHSHRTGTLRVFERKWADEDVAAIELLGSDDKADGLALFVLASEVPKKTVIRRREGKPLAFLTTLDPSGVVNAAREVAAIDDVLSTADDLRDDWVAYRELQERRLEAMMILEAEFEQAFGTASGQVSRWTYLEPAETLVWSEIAAPSASSALSTVADTWYSEAPIIHNDLVNRHELSSQAAKARRLVVEAMLESPEREGLGIEGSGPDRTLYLSILQAFSLHQTVGDAWAFKEPSKSNTIYPAWKRLTDELRMATADRKRVSEILSALAAPPYGIRSGVSSVLVIASMLMYADEVALYEHGTFKPVLSSEVCERLIRNPGNFEVKHFASRTGDRAELLAEVADRLNIDGNRRIRNGRVRSVLSVLSHLVALVNQLPEHVKRTGYLSPAAKAIRGELLSATEPDELFFVAIPRALNKEPIAVDGEQGNEIASIADALAEVSRELLGAQPALLSDIRETLREQFRGPEENLRENLAARAKDIKGKVIDPTLGRLVVALAADIPGEDEWVEYVAMNVTGTPPAAWTDDDRRRFFGLIHDVGGTFRRIEALNADVRSRGESYDALRVTVTRPDGVEAAKLVWVDQVRRQLIEPILLTALEGARAHVGSETEARDLLLAMLAEEDLRAEERSTSAASDKLRPDAIRVRKSEDVAK